MAEAVATGGGRVFISLVEADAYTCPLRLDLVERHPLGSQAFVPLSAAPFLVVVCPDEGGRPGTPQAFLTAPGQGINYHRNTWHGVLTPLDQPADFLVVDRGGEGLNLEEWTFEEPWTVVV
jgi:ureidoglycolate lyase